MTTTAAAGSAYPGAMTTATATTPAKLAALCDALRDQVVAGIRIHDTRAEIVTGATGEPIVRLTLLLDDPAAGETWPLDAIEDMETRAWDEANQLGIPEWVYVKHVPRSDAAGTFPAASPRHRTSR